MRHLSPELRILDGEKYYFETHRFHESNQERVDLGAFLNCHVITAPRDYCGHRGESSESTENRPEVSGQLLSAVLTTVKT